MRVHNYERPPVSYDEVSRIVGGRGSGLEWRCSICMEWRRWSKRHSVFGSYDQQDNGGCEAILCSKSCRDAFEQAYGPEGEAE